MPCLKNERRRDKSRLYNNYYINICHCIKINIVLNLRDCRGGIMHRVVIILSRFVPKIWFVILVGLSVGK